MSDSGSTPLGGTGLYIDKVDRKFSPIENTFNMVAAVAIFGLMILGVLQIGLRSIFNIPIEGYVDLVELSMALLAFLGAAYCQRLGGHIRMEVLVGRFKGRALWATEVFGTVAALIIIGILIWYSADHFWRAYTLGDTSIDAEYPVWPSKLIVPIAFSAWFIRLGIQLVGSVRLLIHPDAAPAGVVLMKDVAEQAREEIRETFGEDPEGRAE